MLSFIKHGSYVAESWLMASWWARHRKKFSLNQHGRRSFDFRQTPCIMCHLIAMTLALLIWPMVMTKLGKRCQWQVILTPAVHHPPVGEHSWAAWGTFSGDGSLVEVSVAFVSAISLESSLVLSSETLFASVRGFLSSVSTVLAVSLAGALAFAVLVEKKVYQIHSSTFQRIAGRARQGNQSIFSYWFVSNEK